MTTIACDGKTMAGDGLREHRNTIVASNAEKIRKLSDGSIVGTAGDVAFGHALVGWLEADCKGETPKVADGENGASALLLKPDGALCLIDKYCVILPIEAPFAIGSGMDIALGAMARAATPAEAVEIAGRYDPSTGGTITVLEIERALKAA